MTAEQIISRSISHNEIVHVAFAPSEPRNTTGLSRPYVLRISWESSVSVWLETCADRDGWVVGLDGEHETRATAMHAAIGGQS